MLRIERRKGWLIYATLFNLPVKQINNDSNFIDIYTSLSDNIFNTSYKGIYLLYKNYNKNIEYVFLKNRFYFDKKTIILNNTLYTIYFFRIINKYDSINKINISDSLLEQYYIYSLKFNVNTTLLYYKNKIIENCCKINYYDYNILLQQDGYENILKIKGQLNLALFY